MRTILIIITMCMLQMNFRAQSVGGVTSGAASYCSFSNSGFVGLSGQVGTVVNWQLSVDNGVTWTTIANTANNQSYFNLTQTTCYRAVVKNGAFPPDTSSSTCIAINQPTVAGTISGGMIQCTSSASGTLTLTGNTGGVLNWLSSVDGGATWNNIVNSTGTLNYSGVTQTTQYLAVIQNSAACLIDSTPSVTVVVSPPSVSGTLSLTVNDTVCYLLNSGAINLSGNTGSVLNWAYSNDNGASWTNINNTFTVHTFSGLTQTLLYTAVVQNGPCPSVTTAPIQVFVLPMPLPVNAGIDTTIQSGQSVTLSGSGTGAPFWIPATGLSNPAMLNPIATPSGTTNYVLTITDANGCINADTVLITVNQSKFSGVVSTYFSPNGDGINDTWFIQDIQFFPNNEVEVYNIYGQLVFSKRSYVNDWKGTYNGSELPDGTYYYVLKFSDSDIVRKGSLDILRKK